jgi:hypothetical protein
VRVIDRTGSNLRRSPSASEGAAVSHISLPNLLCQQHRVRWPRIASAINAQILVCVLLCGADTPLQAEHTVTALPLRSSLSNGLQRRLRVIVRTGSNLCRSPSAPEGEAVSHISLPNLLCQHHRVRWPPIAPAINCADLGLRLAVWR